RAERPGGRPGRRGGRLRRAAGRLEPGGHSAPGLGLAGGAGRHGGNRRDHRRPGGRGRAGRTSAGRPGRRQPVFRAAAGTDGGESRPLARRRGCGLILWFRNGQPRICRGGLLYRRQSQRLPPAMRERMRKLLLIGAAAVALGGSAMAVASQTPRSESFRMLELFGDVLAVVEQAYVVEVDNTKLIEAALDGMMSALDPHSNYLSPDDFGDLTERTEGQYSGVGLTITSEAGLVKVISPMDGGPAARAGVQAGDVISAIEGESAAGLSVSDVSEKLRGAMGTQVRVTFLRDGEEPREVVLTREVIHIDSVTGRVEGDFGYLRVAAFNEKTGRELGETIARLQAENPNIRGYVLDLRNNG